LPFRSLWQESLDESIKRARNFSPQVADAGR
jgi:hypothetical protein